MGGAFLVKANFFHVVLGESGLFYVCFGKKWTFSLAFLEKGDFLACSFHVGGMFPGKILKIIILIMIENCAFRDIMIKVYSFQNCD